MTIVNRFFGWKDCHESPTEPCVLVIGHSSYWDIFVIMIYLYSRCFKNIYCIVQPKLSQWYYKPITYLVNVIIAPPIEKKNNNTTSKIVESFLTKPSTKESPRMLLISPKGTCNKREWRSGYYYMAKQLNYKIYPAFIDFSNREIRFGVPVNPENISLEDATINLQQQLGKLRLLNMECAEYPIDSCTCPYESILPFDFCCVSLLTFIPYLIGLLNIGMYYQFFITLSGVSFAWKYHLDKEGTDHNSIIFRLIEKVTEHPIKRYQQIESYLAQLCIYSHVLYNVFVYNYLSKQFLFSLSIGLFMYLNSAPRGHSNQRGKYAIFHSFYHIMVATCAFSLLFH